MPSIEHNLWAKSCSAALLFALLLSPLFMPGQDRTAIASGARTPKTTHAQRARAIAPAPHHSAVKAKTVAATPPPHQHPADRLRVFRGLGAWLDLYDLNRNMDADIAVMKSAGVRTLYIQTGRSNTKAWVDPRVGPWMVKAHEAGIMVVGWYLPYYANVSIDLVRSIAVQQYAYRGHHIDGLGVDVEFHGIHNKGKWNSNVAKLNQMLRVDLHHFPIAAITPPPLQMQVATSHWSGFPWRSLGRSSDAILLMSYWTDRSGCPAVRLFCSYEYTAGNVTLTRTLVGTKPLVHVIGGVGRTMTQWDAEEFVRGARDSHADGASIYDIPTMRGRFWGTLSALRKLGD